MKEIKLGSKNGIERFSLVDDEDYETINAYRWYCSSTGYVVRIDSKTRKAVFMHRLIMNTPIDMETDHKDHNRLNNQKNNLRVCTAAQNAANRIRKSGLTGLVGVRRYNKRYASLICYGGKQYYLGMFDTKEDAAKRYNDEAVKIHKEFARLNII